MKLRKGDKVVVIAGKSRGARGEISAVLTKSNKVIIDNVNIAKRHTVAKGQNSKSEIINKAMPIHVSNVAIESKGKASRIGYKIDKKGKKVRVARKTQTEISVEKKEKS